MSPPDLKDLLAQAQQMQERIAEAQRQLANRRVEASSGGGMVTAVATCELRIAETMAQQGDLWGDPCDVSRLRREDWDFVKPRTKADDLLSSNNGPSTGVARGHQFPMAFLAIAAGLDQHGPNSEQPLAYTHVDIAGSATVGGDWQHGQPTGRPVVAMLASLIEGATPA